MKNPTLEAIDAAGGPSALSRAVGVSSQAVCKWRKDRRIPAERVLAVERASGVPRTQLRPDIYPSEAA